MSTFQIYWKQTQPQVIPTIGATILTYMKPEKNYQLPYVVSSTLTPTPEVGFALSPLQPVVQIFTLIITIEET
jgi:hypothetical protein